MRIELSQEMINKGLRCPDGRKKAELGDAGSGGVPGLFIEVRASSPGNGTWWLRWKNVHGETRYQRLGSIGDLTLVEARKTAKRLRAEICLGADPRAEEQKKREVPTFGEFFLDMYMPHAKRRRLSAERAGDFRPPPHLPG